MNRNRVFLLAGTILLLAGVAFFALQGDALFAQDGPGGGWQPRGQRMPGMRGMMGGAAMTSHGNHLFVLQGNVLYKIDTNAMKIAGQLELKPAGAEGNEGRPGGREGGREGGGRGW